LTIENVEIEACNSLEDEILSVKEHLPVTDVLHEEIQKVTSTDPTLMSVKEAIERGWITSGSIN